MLTLPKQSRFIAGSVTVSRRQMPPPPISSLATKCVISRSSWQSASRRQKKLGALQHHLRILLLMLLPLLRPIGMHLLRLILPHHIILIATDLPPSAQQSLNVAPDAALGEQAINAPAKAHESRQSNRSSNSKTSRKILNLTSKAKMMATAMVACHPRRPAPKSSLMNAMRK